MKTAYTYTILRYVHDVTTGESLNVGVVLLAPKSRFLSARIQTNYGRLGNAFPNLDGDSHRVLMRYLQSSFDQLQAKMVQELPFGVQPESAADVAARVLPRDDSSLQWSPVGSGVCIDPAAELTRLFVRMVTANDAPRAASGRNDDTVWSTYRGPLDREMVLPHLTAHNVATENDEHVFEHAWRNHAWHCLEPFSLDLLDAENIKAKAHRLLGQMIGVRSAVSDCRLYLMVGEPQLEKCKPAAHRALNLLNKDLPDSLATKIIRESEADAFSREFAQNIRDHIAETRPS